MGVAWGAIQLQDAIVNKSKKQFVTLKGGTIDEDTEIKPEEILQKRTGIKRLLHVKKMACKLQLTFLPITSNVKGLNADDRASIRLLPPTIICSVECIKLLHVYRYIMSNGYSQALSGESDRKVKKQKKKKKGRRRNSEDDSDGSDESDESDASDYSGSDDNSDSDDEDSSSRRHQRRRGRNGRNDEFC